MIKVNKVDTIDLIPFKLTIKVRVSCDIINEVIEYIETISRVGLSQNREFKDEMIIIFNRINILVEGIKELKT
jgi:hypothetical protein